MYFFRIGSPVRRYQCFNKVFFTISWLFEKVVTILTLSSYESVEHFEWIFSSLDNFNPYPFQSGTSTFFCKPWILLQSSSSFYPAIPDTTQAQEIRLGPHAHGSICPYSVTKEGYFRAWESQVVHTTCCQQPIKINDSLKYTLTNPTIVCMKGHMRIVIYALNTESPHLEHMSLYTIGPVCEYHSEVSSCYVFQAVIDRLLPADCMDHLWLVGAHFFAIRENLSIPMNPKNASSRWISSCTDPPVGQM